MRVINKILFYINWGQVVLLSLSLLVVPGIRPGLCSQQSLDFIYIDSSVDEAAGGHAALRLGHTVFHYQYYDEGYFLLVKDTWDDFRYKYNDLQNRTLAIAEIPLSIEAYRKIKNRFLARYLLQEKRFAYLKQLEAEEIFFQDLFAGRGYVAVRGLGFFSFAAENDPLALSLKDYIGHKLGPAYLEKLLGEIEIQLKEGLQKLQPYSLESQRLDLYSPSLFSAGKTHDYFELHSLHQAVAVLIAARPVLGQMLFSSAEDIKPLNEFEIAKLGQYKQRLRRSILSLLQSSRPGRGSALLIQTARFQAISRSINKGRLITLDPFSEAVDTIRVDHLKSVHVAVRGDHGGSPEASGYYTYFEQIRQERADDVRQARDNFFLAQDNIDISFNQLEAALGQLGEIDRADKNHGKLRLEEGSLLPGRQRMVQVPVSLNRHDFGHFQEVSRAGKTLLQKQLLDVYEYNIFAKNCVTELFATVYSSFGDRESAEKELGGYLEPGEDFSFIPFQSFNLVRQRFPLATIEVLPSFHQRQIQELYRQQGARAYWQESNTLTSAIYFPWENDSAFLFFTQEMILFRPILGTVNFLYAAISSLGGIVWFPVDEGLLLKRSLRGMVFSLPELAFFNIRKGTFPTVVYENNRAGEE